MKVKILGGGPAGLYAAYRIRRDVPGAEVTVFEQNHAHTTFGFGVVFSDRALEFLAAGDEETLSLITAGLERWSDIELRVHGQRIRVDGVGFTAIGRLHLLDILRERALSVGATLIDSRVVHDLAELGEANLVIGADGVNSLVRRTFEPQFGTQMTLLENRFAWFGATRPFDYLTQTFKQVPQGSFNAHHYRYAPSMSTFLVEVDAQTFERVGFEQMNEEQSRRYCEDLFADELEGARLVTNKSIWRRFPVISNQEWAVGKHVLLGDALRTAHFSIGSGTRLALEDVQALVHALAAHPGSVDDALGEFVARRKPIVDKLAGAATRSATWYDHFAEHLNQPAWEFAMSYIGRSGRIDPERLRAMSPRFVDGYEAWRSTADAAVVDKTMGES
ncbi:FAD-dependent monooxygenase [Variovorax paradoxus]|uniref:FAD-dependent monooxygenase n=1 Tax=Variovorax paradoxus TaxID=34073 RepID=UPI0029C75521|nr:FAD-dependent monooxygenase [Variovorax paradoxus]